MSINTYMDLFYKLTCRETISVAELHTYLVEQKNTDLLDLHTLLGMSVSKWFETLESGLYPIHKSFQEYSLSIGEMDMWNDLIKLTDLSKIFIL
jgi:hypothetical protein